jgi:hypothetical protein
MASHAYPGLNRHPYTVLRVLLSLVHSFATLKEFLRPGDPQLSSFLSFSYVSLTLSHNSVSEEQLTKPILFQA